jgi:hypothetical protein
MTKQLWQFSESPQRLNDTAREVVSLRRENRFLKVGLIFCLVLSALPYLTGFQPTVIRASKVVTEKIEFVRDGKTEIVITAHPKGNGLLVCNRNGLPIAYFKGLDVGNTMGVCNAQGKATILIADTPIGGSVSVYNKDDKLVASVVAMSHGGSVITWDNKGNILWSAP